MIWWYGQLDRLCGMWNIPNVNREANKHNEGNEEKVAVGRFVKLLPNILGDLAAGDSQQKSIKHVDRSNKLRGAW